MACSYPLTIRDRTRGTDILPVYILVPCGRCISCIETKRSAWTFRLLQELKTSTHATFLTLTYDEAHLPEGGKLVKKDVQNYFKNVRHDAPELKYYAVGEYGEKSKRPHYHAIVFNVPTSVLCKHWTDKHTENPKGFSKCGQVNQATIHYVTGYVVTKYGKIDEKTGKSLPTWTADDVKPFALMSKGLGKIYLKHNTKFHKGNFTTTTRLEGGRPALLPRYYRERIFDKVEQQMLCIISREEAEIRQQDPNYNKSEFEKRRFQVLNTQRSILKKSL